MTDAIRAWDVDALHVRLYGSRADMGAASAHEVTEHLRTLLGAQEAVSMIFAAAPSQNEFLQALCAAKDMDWQRVRAFHMDEYVGLPEDAPQGFGNFLRRAIFDRLPFGQVECLRGNAPDVQAECDRYAALLAQYPPDIVCMGIGENGHIAFNDPPVADFADPARVKAVTLDAVCRQQQVNDGCFARLADVPTAALTLTVPALMAGKALFCIVPAATKRRAVLQTLTGPVNTACPASVLRTHPAARLYLDRDSGADFASDG